MKLLSALALLFAGISSRKLKNLHSNKNSKDVSRKSVNKNKLQSRNLKSQKKTQTQALDETKNYMVEEGVWGDWKPTVAKGAEGQYLCGFLFTAQNTYMTGWLGMDGLKGIFCDSKDWKTQTTSVAVDRYDPEDWQSFKCPENSWILETQVKFQQSSGWFLDDTAMNGLQVKCKDPYTLTVHQKMVFDGPRGDWKDWKTNGMYLVGLKVRYEDHLTIGDNTGLNGIKVYYNDFACKTGTILGSGQTCFQALSNCKQQKDSKCSTCNDGFLLGTDQFCYAKINQCKTQNNAKCTDCNCGWVQGKNLFIKTMETAMKNKTTATLKAVTCAKLVMLDFLLKVMENATSQFPVVWDTI